MSWPLGRLADERMTVRVDSGEVYRGVLRWDSEEGCCWIDGIEGSWYPEQIVMIDLAAPERCPATGRRAIEAPGNEEANAEPLQTTVHDKPSGLPLAGRDGDGLASLRRVAEALRELDRLPNDPAIACPSARAPREDARCGRCSRRLRRIARHPPSVPRFGSGDRTRRRRVSEITEAPPEWDN